MRKLFFILTLLCVSLMGWATEYCCEEMTAIDGVTKAYISCTNPSENTYVIALYSNAASYSGIIGDNFHCKINGAVDPNCHMTDDAACVKNWDSSNKIYTFTITSTTAPVMTSPIYLNISGEKTFTTIQGASFDWPASCSCSFPGDDPDPTEIYNTNFALQSNGATAAAKSGNNPGEANDNNKGSRWWSSTDAPMTDAEKDDQWWQVDLGQRRIFNTIHILWEGAWGQSFDIQMSNDGSAWTTVKEIRDQDLSSQTFPYLQILTLDANKTARYVRFQGIKRGTNYAYSFWEFRVLLPTESVLTNIALSATNDEALIGGSGVALTSVLTDQNDVEMAGSVSYEITPAGAGHMSGNTYIPDQMVNASIRSYNGTVYSNAVTVLGVPSPNLALSTNIDTDNKIIAQSDFSPNGTNAFYAVDGNNGSVYQGSSTNGTDADEAARTYDCWFTVDLGDSYDIDMITILFEGACAELYHLDFSADNSSWETGYNYVGSAGVNGRKDILTSSLSHNTNVRYVKFVCTRAATQYGMKIFEFQVFGSEAASPTKSVSAAVNDPAMGMATVKQNDEDVTEVATGSTVTFSATPNDGYIFVDWSNGNTNATFNATVDAAMNLTANFRALNHICCNEEMTNGDYTAYVTYKKTANDNEYVLIVRSAKEMVNFTNAFVGHINGTDQINMNGQGVLSGNGHMLSYTFTSTTEPKMNTPLYVNFANHGEVTFNQIDNSTVFEYSQPCADPEITAIELNKTEATLDMGNTLTLVPTFTPSYMSADITWQTSSDAVATVSNGVVTPVAPGSVTITAKVTESIKATCAVTVQAATSHNWYGYGTSQDLDYTYRIEYTTDHHIVAHVKRQGYIVGLVAASMEINKNNVWTTINVTEGEEEGWEKGTTTLTYTAGDNVHILIQSASSGPLSKIEFDYEVGSDNVMPTIEPSTLALSNTSITMGLSDADVQLTAEIHHRDAANKTITWTSDDEDIVSVANGLVHPVGVGTTTIHAATFNGFSASCEVTITGSLVPTTWYGYGTFTPQEGLTGFTYSITRNVDHSLTYTIVLDRDPVGFVGEVNIKDDGVYSGMTYTSSTRTATFTTAANYALDGDVLNKSFWWLKSDNNVDRIDFTYTVGSSNAALPQAVAVDETKDNTAILTTYDGRTVVGVLGRSFTAGNLYTLVLPFDVDAAQTASQLPGQLTKLNNSYEKANGDLRINFVDASAIEAGVPYLYKPSANVTNPAFVGVTVDGDLNPTEPADGLAKYYGIYAPMDGDALHAKTNAYVLGPDQYLYAVADLPATQTMAALRGYFVLNFPPAGPGAPKRLAKVVFNENETETTTDIEDLQTDNTCIKVIVNGQLQIIRDGKTYNAFGQLVK